MTTIDLLELNVVPGGYSGFTLSKDGVSGVMCLRSRKYGYDNGWLNNYVELDYELRFNHAILYYKFMIDNKNRLLDFRIEKIYAMPFDFNYDFRWNF